VLEEVAKRLGKLPPGRAGGRPGIAGVRGRARRPRNRVRTNRVGSTNIIEIIVTSPARGAKDLANAVAEVYKEYSASLRNARIVEARKFIEQQLARWSAGQAHRGGDVAFARRTA